MSRAAVLSGSTSGALLWATGIVVAFVMTPILVHGLGESQYGVWDLMIGLFGYFGLLDLGISPAVLRNVAHARGAKEHRRLQQVFSAGLLLTAVMGVVGSLFMAGLSPFGAQILGATETTLPRSMTLFMLFAGLVLVSMPVNALAAYLLGQQRNTALNLMRIGFTISTSVLVLLIMRNEEIDRLLSLALLSLIAKLVELLALTFWIRLRDPELSLSPRHASIAIIKDLASYGAYSALLMASTSTARRLSGFVISHTAGLSFVVYYALASRLTEYAGGFISALGYPLTTHLASTAGAGSIDVTRREFLLATRILQFFSLGMAIGLLTLGEPFLRRWVGPHMADGSHQALLVFGAGMLVGAVGTNSNRMLLALARHKPAAVFAAICAPIALSLSFLLARNFGVVGAATGVVIYTIATTMYEWHRACEELGLLKSFVFRKTMVPIIPALAVMTTALLALRTHQYPSSYSAILLHIVIATFVYGLMFYLTALNSNERCAIRGRINDWLRKDRKS